MIYAPPAPVVKSNVGILDTETSCNSGGVLVMMAMSVILTIEASPISDRIVSVYV